MSVIQLYDLNLSQRINLLFEQNNWLEDDELIYNLEKYKFKTRESLIDLLADRGLPGVKNIESLTPLEKEEDKAFAEKVLRELNVLVYSMDSSVIKVISNVFNQRDPYDVSLRARGIAEVEITYVTPENFRILSGSDEDWVYSVLLRRIVLECMAMKGRDIHFRSGWKDGRVVRKVSYRVGEFLKESRLFTLNENQYFSLIERIAHGESKALSGDLPTLKGIVSSATDIFRDKEVDLRISASQTVYKYKAVLRVQTVNTTTRSIEELGFSGEVQEVLHYMARRKSGLSLVAGAINTGKNTSLFSVAKEILEKPVAMTDISSPIETLLDCDQIDYGDNPDNLKAVVSAIKKQDPDVVMMNEIPNRDVGAELKDLVISNVHVMTTFHIGRVWDLPYKMKEYFNPDFKDMFFHLNVCITQKMFEIQCPHCQKKAHIESLPKSYQDILMAYNVEYYFKSEGCPRCQGVDPEIEIQPYAEWVVFDGQLLDQILQVEQAYDMSRIIKQKVIREGTNLEKQLSLAIRDGKLAASCLESII